ncbi:MAG: flagellar basal body-associated FliL family protein [Halanaerobiales bacterium]|nr:flagellar basal body-associated FliL family protein [Halanaerobiales bacterium]
MADKKMNIKMIALISILVIIITGAVSFTFFTYFSVSEGKDSQEKIGSVKNIKPTYDAGNFLVNISNNNNINYIRASIVFELESSDLRKELEKRKAQLRDRIISTLRSQNKTILEEPDGETIKEIIREEVNDLLISGKIGNVWFTKLVVQ